MSSSVAPSNAKGRRLNQARVVTSGDGHLRTPEKNTIAAPTQIDLCTNKAAGGRAAGKNKTAEGRRIRRVVMEDAGGE